MPKHKKHTPGFKIKRKRGKKGSLPRQVTQSKAYKEEKRRGKKGYATAGFRFGRTTTSTPPRDKSKEYAAVSQRTTTPGKTEKQLTGAIARMKIKEPVTTTVQTKGTLGHRPIVVRKKRKKYR